MTWSWLIEGTVAFVASNVDELLVSVMQFGEAVRVQDSNPPSSRQIDIARSNNERQQESEYHFTASVPTERTPLQPSGVHAYDTETLRVWQVVLGQLVGFTLILLLSLAGYALGSLVERPWIGLLGLLPIALGIKELVGECRKLCRKARTAAPPKETLSETNPDAPHRLAINDMHTLPAWSSWSALKICCSTRTLQVASIAFASGSDSIGVYVPLFASSTIGQMVVLILLFYLMFFLWMWLAYKLVHFRIVARLIKEYGEFVGPVLLILLGMYILYDCHTVDLYYRYTR